MVGKGNSMVNCLQKTIYFLANGAPLIVILDIVFWKFYKEFYVWYLMVMFFSVLIILLALISFYHAKKHLQKISVKMTNIREISSRIQSILSLILFIIACIGALLKTNIYTDAGSLLFITSAGTLALLEFKNILTSRCNVLLVLLGYNFYKVNLSVGISDCILITKKHLINQNEVQTVRHFWGYYYISGDD